MTRVANEELLAGETHMRFIRSTGKDHAKGTMCDRSGAEREALARRILRGSDDSRDESERARWGGPPRRFAGSASRNELLAMGPGVHKRHEGRSEPCSHSAPEALTLDLMQDIVKPDWLIRFHWMLR